MKSETTSLEVAHYFKVMLRNRVGYHLLLYSLEIDESSLVTK